MFVKTLLNERFCWFSGESDPRRHRKCHQRCQRRQSEEETGDTEVRTNQNTAHITVYIIIMKLAADWLMCPQDDPEE